MSDHYNTYVGARYVPIFDGAWVISKSYEPLTIVQYQGDSYTSKTYVPAQISISNEDYWVKTGNYNAQVEHLSNQVDLFGERLGELQITVGELSDDISGYDDRFTDIDNHFTAWDYRITNIETRITNEVNTLNDKIDSEVETLNTSISNNVTALNGSISTLSNHVDTEVERLDSEIANIQISGGFVSPEMYGAVGDGVTDDTVALKNCFADAGANKLVVRGVGKYLIGSSQQTIQGYSGVLITKPVTAIGLNITLGDNAPEHSTILTCLYNPSENGTYRFIDCKFKMSGVGYITSHTADSNGYHGVLFAQSNLNNTVFLSDKGNIYFENCVFDNIFGYSIYVSPVENTTIIKNCKFIPHNNGEGIVCYSQNSIIDGCEIKPNNASSSRPYLIYDHLNTLQVSEQNCNLLVSNCKAESATGLFAHSLLAGEIRYYNTFKFDNCYAYYNGVSINTFNEIMFENGVEINNCLLLGTNSFTGNTDGTTETLKITDSNVNSLSISAEKLYMENVKFNNITALLTDMFLSDCKTTSDSDGAINSPTSSRVNIANIYIDNMYVNNVSAAEHLIKNVTFTKCFINGLFFDGIFSGNRIVDNTNVSASNENLLVIKGFTYKNIADESVVKNVYSVVLEYSGAGYITADDCVNFKKIANWF